MGGGGEPDSEIRHGKWLVRRSALYCLRQASTAACASSMLSNVDGWTVGDSAATGGNGDGPLARLLGS